MSRPTTPSTTIPALVTGTPVTKKASGTTPFTSLHHERDYGMRQLGAEMSGKIVGPMPPAEFLDTFLPFSTPDRMP